MRPFLPPKKRESFPVPLPITVVSTPTTSVVFGTSQYLENSSTLNCPLIPSTWMTAKTVLAISSKFWTSRAPEKSHWANSVVDSSRVHSFPADRRCW